MKAKIFQLSLLILMLFQLSARSQPADDKLFPVKGFCIGLPGPSDVDRFVRFINDELAPRGVNTLVLLVDYAYQYECYPQLRDSAALSKAYAKKIVTVCRKNNIRILPQIDLLGHQSWAGHLNKLLANFPEFDETPYVKMPENYVWPNPDGLYCKSYCPLHPEVHKVIFALVDELCDAFETDAFHAGMDEVFYLGSDSCPRCAGVDKAVLFAGEVTLLRNHLAEKNRELWIWGDRLIDGKATGIGLWEASYNSTYRAVDMIPKDVVICDWHYERPDQTAVYFAMKGLRVVTCPWRQPKVAVMQTEDMARWRTYATPEMKPRYYGMLETTWTDPVRFMDGFYGIKSARPRHNNNEENPAEKGNTPWDTFRAMFDKMKDLEDSK